VEIHPQKTEAVIFTRKDNINIPDIKLGPNTVTIVEQHKNLGMILDRKLSWKPHIEYVSTKARKILGMMKYYKYKLNRKALETTYFSNILSILDYGSIFYDSASKIYLTTLDDIHKEASRIITGAKKRTCTAKLDKESGFISLTTRRTHSKINHLFKIICNKSPSYLRDIIPSWANGNFFRRDNILLSKYCKTERYNKCFVPSTIKTWNNLDTNIRHSTTVNQLKSRLHKNMRTHKDIPPFHYSGKRKYNIIHTRLRLGCSDLNGHKHDMHLIEDPTCPHCENMPENINHYLFNCPQYTEARDILLRKIITITNGQVNIDCDFMINGSAQLETELNTAIFKSVQEYIEASERF
jgi:hypothetical protein